MQADQLHADRATRQHRIQILGMRTNINNCLFKLKQIRYSAFVVGKAEHVGFVVIIYPRSEISRVWK